MPPWRTRIAVAYQGYQSLTIHQADGVDLAGHGWFHRCVPRIPFHKLYSHVISRNAGEHLNKDAGEIAALIRRCHSWFADNGLKSRSLYVPPAWALGPVDRRMLDQLPFRYYETLTWVYDSVSSKFHRLPVVGFEADTLLRKHLLQVLNRLSMLQSQLFKKPLRLAIHPCKGFAHLTRWLSVYRTNK